MVGGNVHLKVNFLVKVNHPYARANASHEDKYRNDYNVV